MADGGRTMDRRMAHIVDEPPPLGTLALMALAHGEVKTELERAQRMADYAGEYLTELRAEHQEVKDQWLDYGDGGYWSDGRERLAEADIKRAASYLRRWSKYSAVLAEEYSSRLRQIKLFGNPEEPVA